MESVGNVGLWVGFTLFVLAMLALDLGVFHREARAATLREALGWTAAWVSLALLFNVGIYLMFGIDRALEFLTGYLIEETLSVDNLFVFLVLFSAFRVPAKLQHRVLFWGILGALVSRAVFIVSGAALLQRFHWIAYVFGAFLVFTGLRLLVQRNEEVHPEDNPLLRLFRRVIPSVPHNTEDGRFTVVQAGKRYATPLLFVLLSVEATDIVFALDSIPAIFAVTTDPFIVYTSNIFAILGLRALYFALSGMVEKFRYLKVGLSLILMFVGVKMLIAGVFPVPTAVSLGVIAGILTLTMLASWLHPAPPAVHPADGPSSPPQ